MTSAAITTPTADGADAEAGPAPREMTNYELSRACREFRDSDRSPGRREALLAELKRRWNI